ncbi:MAG: MFS transporter [Ferrovum sp. 37-45-19]|jgi:MFS family permease|uniref:MFS transporter n=1 Tax=Ferrovum sp. JA12 TaxID=1356299 RepID=UPI0007038374|nr:MFS transporter [Ferrovum sp. JA12]OYV79983.1 MAG: MFS transporter [Ferrovum sp. 21-44-67]OYV94066.1 MAG: MFS transporter [Ferrovum sp. 37-45-19]OZB33955.1 MAG: MFS transporter [Ferrovum sp. 34-44-207]HQT82115.1 MFS transporter [Ferrovaceae bacterium]KRH78301.1 putative sialic acid transporter [Ferrovum sp. JA12]
MGQGNWREGLTRKHWQILLGSFLGWVFDGYEAFALIVVIPFLLKSLLPAALLPAGPLYAGSVIGITLLGWGIGGLVGGILADYVGRRQVMLWSVFLYALFSGLTAFVHNFYQLDALRLLTGLAMGSEWATGVSLVAETWPNRARPIGAGFLQSGFGWGTLLAAAVWYVLSITQPLAAESWRLMFVLGAIPAVFVLYLRRNLDESQKWKEAILAKRWGATGGVASSQNKRPFTLFQLFREKEALRRTIITFLLSLATTTGWWAVSSLLPRYTVFLAKTAGMGQLAQWGALSGLLYTLGAVVAYLLAGFVIDGIGRRRFLFGTYLGCLVITWVSYGVVRNPYYLLWLTPINGFFTLGCAYVWMAIYPPELFATSVRATAASVIFNGARIIAWVFPVIAGSLIQSFGSLSIAALTISTIYLLGLFLPWLLPETTHQELPE